MSTESDWLNGSDRHLLSPEDEMYPPLLRQIPSPPKTLWVDGDPLLLWQPQVAIVGSRNPTRGGLDHARAFATELSQQGFAITSGLASGIDAEAHRAALDAGGITIAVNGTGLDLVYPTSSTALARDIRQRGVMVSEFPPGTQARRQNFPSRNRIISGLSLGVLVVEAGLNSGTLITARKAADQGREVFALPGSLHNPMAKGCHRLIKQGARLTESTGEIIEGLAPLAAELALELKTHLVAEEGGGIEDNAGRQLPELLQDEQYMALWDCIAYDPTLVNTLVERSGFSAREVSSMLLMMELEGLIETAPGGMVKRLAI